VRAEESGKRKRISSDSESDEVRRSLRVLTSLCHLQPHAMQLHTLSSSARAGAPPTPAQPASAAAADPNGKAKVRTACFLCKVSIDVFATS
jgi:hypothetical protein